MLGLPIDVAATATGLRLLVGASSLMALDPRRIAQQLFAGENLSTATDRVVLHVLMLEDAGLLSTWSEGGLEWLSLTPPASPAPQDAPPHVGPVFAHVGPPSTGPFSSAGERERKREDVRADERARARERARERAQAEEQAREDRWARWEQDYVRLAPARPQRPARLDAPPIGCPDHPQGSRTPCGPCGTYAERRRVWLENEKYTEQLAIFEEQQEFDGKVPVDDDTPF